jgi:hypothetical protein
MFDNCLSKNRAVYDNVEKYGRAGRATDEITRRTRIACCIPMFTDTHSKYVILAFSLEQ